MKKLMSLLMAVVMICSLCVPAFAAENTADYSAGTQVEYSGTANEQYTITVPALLPPGGSGNVTLEGTWSSDRIISVTAQETVKLTNSISGADEKILDITFAGISEAGNNTESQTFAKPVSVDGIRDAIFGVWSGIFHYNVKVSDAESGGESGGTTTNPTDPEDPDVGGGSGDSGESGNPSGGFPIEWNSTAVVGNTSVVVDGAPFVKVSDYSPSDEELSSSQVTANYNGEKMVIPNSGTTVVEGGIVVVYGEFTCFSISTPCEVNGTSFTEPGFYVIDFATAMGIDADFVVDEYIPLPTPDAPEAPTAASVSDNSVTLNVIEGCEYSLDGATWQDSTTFSGLTGGTSYTFYARYKATSSFNASESSSADIRTTGYAEFVVKSSNRSLVGYTGAENEALVIPATFYDENADVYYKVVGISMTAFQDCTGLTSVDIPEGVTFIGAGAFEGCSNLAGDLVIPESVTSIDNSAFAQCRNLESVQIPDSVTSMGEFVFNGCTNLQSVTIGNGVTCIDRVAFGGCTSLDNVSIGNQVATIELSAFGGCTSLTSVEIPDSVTSIGNDVFMNCQNLAKVDMSTNVTSIGERAFYNTALTTIGGTGSGCSLELPSTLTYIDDELFYSCDNLTKVTLPDSVVSIGSLAFYKCSSLSSIEITDNVTSIGASALSHCSSLTKVELPDNLEEIAAYTFSECAKLSSVSIPAGVTHIDIEAFGNCANLTNVEIPASVKSISKKAFFGCINMTDVTFGNPNGWYVTTTEGDASGTDVSSEDLADSDSAAYLLLSTYLYHYWYCSE